MINNCSGNCITCGKCASAAILEKFIAGTRAVTPRDGYGIAIDIGTTTVVLSLLNLTDGQAVARHSFMNPQRAFGPDVISRIDAANKGSLGELNGMITGAISAGITALLEVKGVSPAKVIDITIACNTVMTYLLLGFPCESLGVVPFKPAHSLAGPYKSSDLFPSTGVDCIVRITPWIAAYIGGDITAGLIHVLPEGNKRFMLLDLGTNGEIAMYDNGRLIVTATAAGPAFEQPVAASQGTEQPFKGASEVIRALADLVRNEIVDESGFMDGEDAILNQKQVRDLQLAKSAIRSGLEILLEICGYSYGDLDAVYLAGGIGQAMNVQDAIEIGLIPRDLEDKARPAGNTSLGGATALLTAPGETAADIEKLLPTAEEINLAAQPNFNDYFMDYMSFERD